MNDQVCENTDVRLWEEPATDFKKHFSRGKIFVTKRNGIGIECGGYAIVTPLRNWHTMAKTFMPHRLESTSWRFRLARWLLKPNEYKATPM